MLTAILHGKAGRVEIDGHPISWRDLFRKREDLLTAVLFGRLPYLSEAAHDAFLSLLVGNEISDQLGQLRDIQFWPKLNSCKERRYVEPDLIIEYNDHRLLIEVKPPFGGIQSLSQWREEVRALQQQDDDPKQVVLVALGRNQPEWRSLAIKLEKEFPSLSLHVVCKEWPELLNGVRPMLEQAETRDARIFQDWLEAFYLFGMMNDMAPFSELLPLCSSAPDPRTFLVTLLSWTTVKTSSNKGVRQTD